MAPQDLFYDYVILGTGLEQCILSYKLSLTGKKVLQIDRNTSYGSDLRTLRYSDLISRHNANNTQHKEPNPTLLSLDKKFNIDITPKFLLANGLMTDFLSDNDMCNLVEFVNVQGSFVYKKGKLHCVPCSETSSFKSGLIDLLQKPRVASFFWNVKKYCNLKEKFLRNLKEGSTKSEELKSFSYNKDISDSSLNSNSQLKNKVAILNNENLKKVLSKNFEFPNQNMKKEFEYYKLNTNSTEMIGHVIALNTNDDFLEKHPIETYDKIFFYVKSLMVLDQCTSPFIYPLYGLSEICQAFSRRAGSVGCVFMLNTPILEIRKKSGEIIEKYNNDTLNVDKNNESKKLEEEIEKLEIKEKINETSESYKYALKIKDNFNNFVRMVKTNKIITEPEYMPSITKKIGEIIIDLCIIKGDVDILKKYEVGSAHIIFLASELKRKNDVFLAVMGERENCCPEGYSIAIISTIKEDEGVDVFEYIRKKLGDVVENFCWSREIRVSSEINSFEKDDILVSKSVDQTTHFESLYSNIVESMNILGI